MDVRRLNFEADDDGLLVCWGLHEKSSPCQYERLNPHEALKLIEQMRSELLNLRCKIDTLAT